MYFFSFMVVLHLFLLISLLQIEVRLNGLGQWTGRHMTASLQVLEGEWDPLLQWPFNQRVTLTLRDQNTALDKVELHESVYACMQLIIICSHTSEVVPVLD
jgi:hypothetical protein